MKPLSRKTRLTILTILSFIFLAGAPVLILYSTGYRLGDALSIVRTGGVFVHSNLAGTRVYVEDEFIENNGRILRNTLVQNLRPNRSYTVRVEKDDFHTWEKDIVVFPNLVTEAQVLMLPTEIEFREIEMFEEVATSTVISSLSLEQEINPEYEVVSDLFSESLLAQFEVEVSTTTLVRGIPVVSTSTEIEFPSYIEDLEIPGLDEKEMLREKHRMLAWIDDGEVFVVWSGNEASRPYFFCLVECAEVLTVSDEERINRYDFMPGRDDVLVILTQSGVYAIEIDARSKPNKQPILLGRGLDFRVENNNTIFIKDGEIFKEVEL